MTTDSFTKLSSGILASTVWQEPNSTRIVWITMLALADRNGHVMASIPGLAHLARVTIAEAEAALQTFYAPDAYSRTPDNEGRRIEAIKGGWRLLNHGAYRAKRDPQDTTDRKREWDRQNRPSGHARQSVKQSDSPTQSDAPDAVRPNPTQAEADTDTDKEQEHSVASLPPSPADADESPAAKPDPVVQVVIDAYHRNLPNCQAVLTLTPKRRRLILAANKIAKSLIAQRSLGVNTAEFWDRYFAECSEDPWLRGDVPDPRSPSWKQNLEVLLRDKHFGDVMDRALARDLGRPA